MTQKITKEANKENKENNKIHKEKDTRTHIIEGYEEPIIDAQSKKILIIIGSILSSFLILMFLILYGTLNIQSNYAGVTESFFSKEITVYNDSGLKLTNPFVFNKLTTYPLTLQQISFSSPENQNSNSSVEQSNTLSNNTSNEITNQNIYNNVYESDGLRVNTKDEISIKVKMDLTYRLKNDNKSIQYVYNNVGSSNFVENIVIPTITSSVSDVYSQRKLIDIVNKANRTDSDISAENDVSLAMVLRSKIETELDKQGFELINFTFGGIEPSEGIQQTLEALFNTQNQKELERARTEILELKNKNALKELELTNNIYKKIEEQGISIEDYQKIKMVQIFEETWNGNTIPSNLQDLLQ